MNRSLPDITESTTELKHRLRSESVGYKTQRLTALYFLQSGEAKTRQQVAALIGVNRKTIGHWLDAYQAGGIDQMLDRRSPPGRVPLLRVFMWLVYTLLNHASNSPFAGSYFSSSASPLATNHVLKSERRSSASMYGGKRLAYVLAQFSIHHANA